MPPQVEAARPRLTPRLLDEARALSQRLGLGPEAVGGGALLAALEGVATLSVEPRGSCREGTGLVAGLLLPGTLLVVSPDRGQLAALGERLDRAGAASCLLEAGRGEKLARIASGAVKVVLALPGALAAASALRTLAATRLSLVVALEAQRLSARSPDFSPVALPLRASLEHLGRPPLFAVAPGATAGVRQDVCDALMPGGATILGNGVLREPLSLEIRIARGDARQRALVEAIRSMPRPLVALCARPRDVDVLHATLRAQGLAAHRYHEDLRAGVRAAEQLEFSMPGDRRILVATSAFAPSGHLHEDDPEGVPLRYGRRTNKADIRSLVRCQPPTSIEQLTDELSLVGRDGQSGRAVLFYDASDRPALEAEALSARPTGEQFLRLGRALESCLSAVQTVTTEALALEARTSLRTAESIVGVLAGMGLVSVEAGWLRLAAPEPLLHRSLQGVAELFATVRALDARRIGDVANLATLAGCPSAFIERHAGDPDARPCGRCPACNRGGSALAEPGTPPRGRLAPARRFTVNPNVNQKAESATFHSDRAGTGPSQPLTAKLADFR